jgi:hypothetical protein
MLNRLAPCLLFAVAATAPALAQDLASHRAAYNVTSFDRGRGTGNGGFAGSYAFELRETCEGWAVNQRMRLEIPAGRQPIVSEQTSLMSETRDGRRFRFEHRATANAKVTSQYKGEAVLDRENGSGQAHFSQPEGQTVSLPPGTQFPVSIMRLTLRKAKTNEGGFETPFFFGDKVKPPQTANVIIGRVPRRLADFALPENAGALGKGERIYFRGGFFDAGNKAAGEPTYEMSSITLDNGVELWGTNEQTDTAIEYRLTRLEPLPKPTCN